MLTLFFGSALATMIAFLSGEFVAKGKAGMAYTLTAGAKSVSTGLVYLAIALAAPGFLLGLLIWLLREIL